MKPRFAIQLVSLALFAVALSGLLYHAAYLAVSLSPLVGLANLLYGYPWTWKLLLGLPVALLAFFKGRYFCFFLCPTGTVLEHVPLGVKRRVSPSRCASLLLVAVLVSSFFTLAVVAVLDPVTIFAGAVNVFQYSSGAGLLWLAVPLGALVVLNALGRRYWCYRLCPLGAMLGIIGKLGASFRAPFRQGVPAGAPPGLSRRSFLSALAGGLAAGWAGSRLLSSMGDCSRRLIRPPGALPEGLFNQKCIRCGNCLKACVTDGLLPCGLEAGWDGIFTPRLVPSVGYCDEYCTACTHSCPTGALRPLSLEEKREERLGIARVDKERCLAWTHDKYCLVCQEVCSYVAIDIHRKENGIPCPVVNPASCRGCGQCEHRCRTEVASAISVYSLARS